MIRTFEEWTDHAEGPKWARAVARLVWGVRPNAIQSPAIEANLGISGNTVRQAVHYLRVTVGAPIASEGGGASQKNKGYRWATEPEDLDLTIQHGEQRAHSIMEWVNACKRIQAEMAMPDVDSRGQGQLL